MGEGATLPELGARVGMEMAVAEANGHDFRARGGESPCDVQTRVAPLLRDIAEAGRPTAAITHKGVIRPVLALATCRDMLGKPPYRLAWPAAHLFRLDAAGRPAFERLNIALERA
jgi:broad specificity phosphatase PhoE